MIPQGDGVAKVDHSNRFLTANCGGVVEVKDCKFEGKTYNSINIGDKNSPKYPSKVLIENVDFSGENTNNAISLYQWADGAEMVIRNCHFAKVSNMLRLGDSKGGKLTVKIIDCVVDEWDANKDYAAAVICQDQSAGSSRKLWTVTSSPTSRLNSLTLSTPARRLWNSAPKVIRKMSFYVHGAGAIRPEVELKPTVTFA